MRTRFTMLAAAVLLSGPWLPCFTHAAQAAPAPGLSLNPPPASALTLEQAIALALSANPALRAATHGVAIADGAVLQAGLRPNPELSVLREGVQRAAGATQTIQLSLPVETGGKRAARIEVAEQDRALAASAVQVEAAALRADVTAAYLDVLAAQQHAELAQQALDLAQRASQAASRRVAAGKISPLEETRSAVAATSARLELAQASASLAGARRRLGALCGSNVPVDLPLAPPEPQASPLPPLEMLQQQLEAAPQLQQGRTQVLRDMAQVHYERAQRLPDVAVTLGRKRDQDSGAAQTVVGITLPLPLFDRNQGNALSAQRRVEQSQARLDADRLAHGQAVADAWHRAHVAQQHIDALRGEMLPAAQRAIDAAVTGFELGKFTFLDVLDAQRTLAQARTQYLNAISERYRAIAQLQRYVALPESRTTP